MRKTLGVWKTTILGGVFFLLPFAVLVFLIGQVAYAITLVATPLSPYTKSWRVGGVSLAVVLATVLVLVACYVAGLAARRSLAARFSERIEKYLLLLFPRYAIIKAQMASNIGGHGPESPLKPVLVTLGEAARLGFEVECAESGVVTVFLPGAPDPWQGHVVHVAAERVAPLTVQFGEAVAMCEGLGRRGSRRGKRNSGGAPVGPRSFTGG